jgi:hypothetical protein
LGRGRRDLCRDLGRRDGAGRVKRIRRCWTFTAVDKLVIASACRCEVVLGTHVQCSETQPGGSLEQECASEVDKMDLSAWKR